MDADDPCLVLCTCPDDAIADEIAMELVTRGLAACVNRLANVRSTYRWEGRIERDDECLLIIKTVSGRVDELTAAVSGRHPHELPEVIAVPLGAAGSAGYLDWIRQSTA